MASGRIRPFGAVWPAVAVVLMMSAAGQAATWTQYGHDAARTFASPDAGPETDDVAFTVRLPAPRAPLAEPLIRDGHAYVFTLDQNSSSDPAKTGIHRVDLRTGAQELLFNVEAPPRTNSGRLLGAFALDAERVYVTRNWGIDAYDLATGAPLWEWNHPPFMPFHTTTICHPPAVRDDAIYLACTEIGWKVEAPLFLTAHQSQWAVFVASLDARTGELRWLWTKDVAAELRQSTEQTAPEPLSPGPAANQSISGGVSVIGPYVFAPTEEYSYPCCGNLPADVVEPRLLSSTIWALDERTGELMWSRSTPREVFVRTQPTGDLVGDRVVLPYSLPTGTPTVAYAKIGEFVHAMNPARGTVIWSAEISREDQVSDFGYSAMGLRDGDLYVTTYATLYQFDAATGRERWHRTLDPALNDFWGGGTFTTGSVVYQRADTGRVTRPTNSTLYALDAADGRVLWRHPVPTTWPTGLVRGPPFSFGLGEGLIAVVTIDGTLTVLGRTEASLKPQASIAPAYPQPGDEVSIDLAGTLPGIQGFATAYRVEWGDGSATDWQPEPRFSHAYESRGAYTVRASARNDAGQTASEFVPLEIGATRPREPGLLERAFSADYQETTYFLMGLIVMATGSAVGLARVKTRRQRVRRRLGEVETLYASLRDRPIECEAALKRYREHARQLALDGKLDQAQYTLLERRIGELERANRLDLLDRGFDYLPYGMVESLRTVLADGRITPWEYENFRRGVDHEQSLTRAQKKQVKELLERWFHYDAAVSDPRRSATGPAAAVGAA